MIFYIFLNQFDIRNHFRFNWLQNFNEFRCCIEVHNFQFPFTLKTLVLLLKNAHLLMLLDEGIDGVPIEISDTSNEQTNETNSTQDEQVAQPTNDFSLNTSFIIHTDDENSPSATSAGATTDASAGANATNPPSSDLSLNATFEDSENLTPSDTESANPFEMSLPEYLRTTRPNVFSSTIQANIERDRQTQSSLRAIFEQAINHHTMPFNDDDGERAARRARLNNDNGSEGTRRRAVQQRAGEQQRTQAAEQQQNADVQMNEPGTSSGNSEEIPEGVDPSFLEALPPDMRREVLEQHRLLCLQQRLASTSSSNTVNPTTEQNASTSTEVSPEFLAALPPALQEEVLTQQRLEQQRQAAARANPNEPVDAGAFFETLQPSLRTMILSDMEDSQMSALPPDLAAEAQTLRRDWYARNRQMAQERFMQTNLTTIIRHSRGRQATLRPSNFHRGQWNQWNRDFINNTVQPSSHMKIRGRQLLDHEGLCCLLVLLFTDDPHLNKLRLHRVIRNLCYHAPTREWIVNALLSIIDKSVHVKPEDLSKTMRKSKPGPLSSKLLTDSKLLQNYSNWLNIRTEAALGCTANVFIVNKSGGKRSDRSSTTSVTIHPQAAPIVCRNTLDLFTSLAKAFPSCLLPIKCIRDDRDEKNVATPVRVKNENSSDFWDVLLRLDSASMKKGKSIAKSTSISASVDSENTPIAFDQSVFGQLLNMLGSPVVTRNTQLTDNLLKLLSVTTSGMPELVKPATQSKTSKQNKNQRPDVSNTPLHSLDLAVNVITYKSCSEEGLEFITSLLINLASSSLDMSFMVN